MGCWVQNRVRVRNGMQSSDQGIGCRVGVQDGVQEVMQSRVHSAEQVAGCRTGSRG